MSSFHNIDILLDEIFCTQIEYPIKKDEKRNIEELYKTSSTYKYKNHERLRSNEVKFRSLMRQAITKIFIEYQIENN